MWMREETGLTKSAEEKHTGQRKYKHGPPCLDHGRDAIACETGFGSVYVS